jgi:hypothetical protein
MGLDVFDYNTLRYVLGAYRHNKTAEKMGLLTA